VAVAYNVFEKRRDDITRFQSPNVQRFLGVLDDLRLAIRKRAFAALTSWLTARGCVPWMQMSRITHYVFIGIFARRCGF
jgi:hypothetical protein